MIVSYLNAEQMPSICASHPLFAKGFDAAQKLMAEHAAEGRYEIDGERLFINVVSYVPKAREESVFESHRRYIDIQLMVEGEEIIGFAENELLTVTRPFEGDAELYGMIDPCDTVVMYPGKFTVIYPGEPHAPGMAVTSAPEKIRKIIIKVLA
ncbi:MAG: DUF386 domain-containing protein [Ruminococcaceae bacterium]|nr:DUF386 domain-containing protein [Oscillospiraceae bacterium]